MSQEILVKVENVSKKFCRDLKKSLWYGVKHVTFCGLDDLTEIAYLSLQEAGLELEQVIDTVPGGRFLDLEVVPIEKGAKAAGGPIVITSLQRAEELKQKLLELGVEEEKILGPSLSYENILSRKLS